MKKFFSILSFLWMLMLVAQRSETDTAQVVVPGRINVPEVMEKPYLILISADGYRYDYSEKYGAKNLQDLSAEGVRAKAMRPSFPSITFPNHWSLITGLYPSHHGLIDNFFYDPKENRFYAMSKAENAEDGSWYGGIPLWALAEKQGMISASLQWVGSASDAGGIRPTYYYHYHEKFSPDQKVQIVVNWLKLPVEKRPHFISLYFPEVDAAGHHFGPEAPETRASVQKVDQAVGLLVKKVKELGLKNVNFIFVSDHGMIDVDRDTPLAIPKILNDKNRFAIFNSQTLLRVLVKKPQDLKPVYHELKKNRTDDYKVILAKRFPRKLYYGSKDDRYGRIGQILLVPRAPRIFLTEGQKTSVGKHGYNPLTTPEMKAVFYAWGPVFKHHFAIGEFANVNVYPLVSKILGLQVTEPIDGNIKVLEKTLKND